MEAAKIFESGEGQAAPPPRGFRFEDSEVPAKRRGRGCEKGMSELRYLRT